MRPQALKTGPFRRCQGIPCYHFENHYFQMDNRRES